MAPQISIDFYAAQAAHPSLMPFHPVVRQWFAERLGEPSRPQVEGWPLIQGGHDTACGGGGTPGLGLILIPGTPTSDPQSIMNSCVTTTRSGEFSYYDTVALRYLY